MRQHIGARTQRSRYFPTPGRRARKCGIGSDNVTSPTTMQRHYSKRSPFTLERKRVRKRTGMQPSSCGSHAKGRSPTGASSPCSSLPPYIGPIRAVVGPMAIASRDAMRLATLPMAMGGISALGTLPSTASDSKRASPSRRELMRTSHA